MRIYRELDNAHRWLYGKIRRRIHQRIIRTCWGIRLVAIVVPLKIHFQQSLLSHPHHRKYQIQTETVI